MKSSQKKSPRQWLGESGRVLDEPPSQLWVQAVNPLECAYSCKEKEMNGQLKNLQIINAGGCVEEREPSYSVGGNVNWYSHYVEKYGGSSEN